MQSSLERNGTAYLSLSVVLILTRVIKMAVDYLQSPSQAISQRREHNMVPTTFNYSFTSKWRSKMNLSTGTSNLSIKGPDPQIKILLDQEKSFQCTEELGWNWHKSWKLPTVSLQLDVFEPLAIL